MKFYLLDTNGYDAIIGISNVYDNAFIYYDNNIAHIPDKKTMSELICEKIELKDAKKIIKDAKKHPDPRYFIREEKIYRL